MVESTLEVISVKDEKFNPEFLSQYHLALCLSISTLEIGVIDSLDNRILSLERYPLGKTNSHEAYVDALSNIFDNHYFLKAGYWKSINVVVNNEKFTLLPENLFVETYAREYLKLNCELNFVYDRIFWHNIPELGITTIFSIHNKVFDWLKSMYPGRKINLLHSSLPAISGGKKRVVSGSNNLLLSLMDNYMMVSIFKDQKLFFCNCFKIKTYEDCQYYLLAILQQFKLKKADCNVTLYYDYENDIRSTSAIKEIFNQVQLGTRPEHLQFGYVFDELKENQFFNICNLTFE